MAKILNISEALVIATHSMGLIARSKTPVTANQVAAVTGFSKNHISKILQQLSKNNFLSSTRGPHGGYILKKDPGKTNLYEIYRLFEGEISMDYCKYECYKCPFAKCVFDRITEKLTKQFEDYLVNKKISQL